MAMACENAVDPSKPCTVPPFFGCDLDWNCPEGSPVLCDSKGDKCATINFRYELDPWRKEAGADQTFCKGFGGNYYLSHDSPFRCYDPSKDAKGLCIFENQENWWDTTTLECVRDPRTLCEQDQDRTYDEDNNECRYTWNAMNMTEDEWRANLKKPLWE